MIRLCAHIKQAYYNLFYIVERKLLITRLFEQIIGRIDQREQHYIFVKENLHIIIFVTKSSQLVKYFRVNAFVVQKARAAAKAMADPARRAEAPSLSTVNLFS